MSYHGLKPGVDKQRWQDAQVHRTQDALEIEGHPVMERWEQPYMAGFAQVVAAGGGRVLEVGFGMGISATAIQRHPVDEHVIIEANAQVFEELEAFAVSAPSRLTPLLGLWEEVVPRLADESFDGIFYDTYPLSQETQHTHQFEFLAAARRLLKPGGVLTYCNLTSMGVLRERYQDWEALFEATQRPRLRQAGYHDDELSELRVVAVEPPAACRYYQHASAPIPVLIKQ